MIKNLTAILKTWKLLLLFVVLGLSVGKGWGQTTVFTDDFSANQSATFTTSGAIGSSSWSITRSGADFGGRRNTSPAQLELTNDASATGNADGWVLTSTSSSSFSSPYTTTLSSNSGLVTWNFNIRQIRSDPAGFGSGSYGVAFILAGTSTTNHNTGSGYAVVLGQSGITDPLRLVRYTSGIQGTMTNIITSNTSGLTDFGAEYLSVRVTYLPSTNTWELFLRNDGGSAFTDPTSGTLTSQGTTSDNTHTGTSLTIMGAWWQGATAANQTAFIDNVSVTVGSAPATNYYYKGSGSVLLATNWTDDVTLAAGSSPSAVDATVTNATWTFQNGSTASLPGSWALGTGSKIVVGGTNAFNLTVVSGTSITGGNGVDVAANGTLTLQHTTIPTFGTLASGSTVDYAGVSITQAITATNYSNLTLSGTPGTRTFPAGTVGISGAFTPGSYTSASTGTIDFNGTGAQTIPAFSYNNLTVSGARTTNNVTLANSGTITVTNTPSITATFTAGNGFVVTGSTVAYTLAGSLTIPILTAVTSGNNYNNLTISGNTASNKTFSGSAAFTIGGTLTTSNTNTGDLILNNTTTARTITINTWNHSSGDVDFGTADVTGDFASTVNITSTLNKSAGTFTNSAPADFYRINFSGTTASISNVGTFQFPAIFINSGTTATLNTDLALTTPYSTAALTVDGVLIAGSNLISTTGVSRVFTINGTLRTTNTNGLSGSASTTIVNTNSPTITLNTGSTIEYNGANQTVTGRNDYRNLIISGSGNKSLSTTTVVNETLTLTAGSLVQNSGNLTFSGLSTTSGTLTPDNLSSITIAGSTGTVGTLNFAGTTPTTGAIIMNRTGQTLTLGNNITFDGSQDVTNFGRLTLTNGIVDASGDVLTFINGNTPLASTNGTLTTNTSTSLIFGTDGNIGGNAITIPNSYFTSAPSLASFTLNRTNGLTLGNQGITTSALTLTTGTLSIASNTLTINGSISRTSGLLRGSTSSNLTLAHTTGTNNLFFDRTSDGTSNALNNVTLSGSGGTTTIGDVAGAGVAQLYVNGILDIQSGAILDVNQPVTANHLVLVSDGSNQARVPNVAGTLTQGANTKIVVERFISLPTPNTRSWRFITAPLTGNGLSLNRTVQYQWQNHQSSPANTLGGTAFGTNIYGPSGNTGMDGTTAGNTMRGWNYSTKAYSSITNTTSEDLFGSSANAANKAYMMFIRGDKTRTPTNGLTSSTRLRAVGRLQTGNQPFTSFGTHTVGNFVAIANPYASPINYESFRTSLTDINSSVFYVWDPRVSSFGGWVTVTRNGVDDYSTSVNTPASFNNTNVQFIQSGTAFFAQATGTAPAITFTESHKVSNTITQVTGAGNGLMDRLGVDLLLINTDNSISVRDGLLMKYKNNFTTAINETTGEDVLKMNQSDETISIMQGSTKLGIEGRGFIQNTDTIKLQMERMVTGTNYKLAFVPTNFDATVTDARLIDKFLNTETPINLNANNEVPFTITTTTGSNAADRFMIVFRGTGNLPNNKLSLVATKKDKDVQLTWNIANEAGVKEYELQRSVDGTNFQAINNQVAANKGEYNNLDTKANNGINYYRVKMTMLNDDTRYSNTITINLQHQTSNPITIYPNPVKGKTIGLQLAGLDKGEYALRLVNAAGQTVYSQNLQVQGSNMSMQITTNQLLAKGNYSLQLISDKGTTYNQQVLVVE